MKTCQACGAASFLEMTDELCDVCAKKHKKKPPARPKRQKTAGMSFAEFEAGKISLNKLKAEWYKQLFIDRQSDKFKKLETDIHNLEEQLRANLRHAFLFPENLRQDNMGKT